MSIDDKESPEVVGSAIENHDDVDRKGTAADRADMYRMGKTQEMRVRTNRQLGLCLIHLAYLKLHLIEKFSLLVHIWIFHDLDGIVGVFFEVNCADWNLGVS